MPAQTPWLLISDVFKGQWTPRVKNLVTENHGKMVPIPGNMTHIFQPLDVSVNRSCKAFFKTSAQQWYADQVSTQVNEGKSSLMTLKSIYQLACSNLAMQSGLYSSMTKCKTSPILFSMGG